MDNESFEQIESKLPFWQRVCLESAEHHCILFGLKPIRHYSDPQTDTMALRRIRTVGTVSEWMQRWRDGKPDGFIIYGSMNGPYERGHFVSSLGMLGVRPGRGGPIGMPNSLQVVLLAVIEEARNAPARTAELARFLEPEGTFMQWYRWRFGEQSLPFKFPIGIQIEEERKTNFKHRIRHDILRSQMKAMIRVFPDLASDVDAIKEAILSSTADYRDWLFRDGRHPRGRGEGVDESVKKQYAMVGHWRSRAKTRT